jgi:hypothetical protein
LYENQGPRRAAGHGLLAGQRPTGWTEPETGEPIMSVVLKEADMPATNRKPLNGAKRIATEALKACNESEAARLSRLARRSVPTGL